MTPSADRLHLPAVLAILPDLTARGHSHDMHSAGDSERRRLSNSVLRVMKTLRELHPLAIEECQIVERLYWWEPG
jgi:hypothetical protein